MKIKILALSAALVVTWTGNLPAASADSASSIIGTWQLTSHSNVTLDTKETRHPFGEHPTGYLQYSPGGHVVAFLAVGDLKRPASAIYTDAERSDIHKGIVGGYAGTYRVDGNEVIHHILTSWRPELIGSDQIRFFEINGKILTIKTAPQKSASTGQEIVSTLTFEKVE
jgi:hypothetical protein